MLDHWNFLSLIVLWLESSSELVWAGQQETGILICERSLSHSMIETNNVWVDQQEFGVLI